MTDRVKFAWGGVRKTVMPATMGMGVAVAMSYAATNPTWKTWLFWILALVGIHTMCFVVHYFLWNPYGRKR